MIEKIMDYDVIDGDAGDKDGVIDDGDEDYDDDDAETRGAGGEAAREAGGNENTEVCDSGGNIFLHCLFIIIIISWKCIFNFENGHQLYLDYNFYNF